MLKEVFDTLLAFAGGDWGPFVLVLHAYTESFIFPGPHDVVLMTVALANPPYSFLFALLSTIFSTLGIMTGYAIGRFGGRPLLCRMVHPKKLALVKEKIHKYDTWAIAIACFTPLPVKVFSLAAGAFFVDFYRLVIIGFLARGARFFLISTLFFFYGEPIRIWIREYLDSVMIGLLLIIFVGIYFWDHGIKHLMQRRKKRLIKIAKRFRTEKNEETA